MGTKRPTTDEADRHLLADIAGAKVDDGGPAFPTTTFQRVGELEEGVSTGGMTLRDYFAAKAMAAMIGLCSEANRDTRPSERGNGCVGALGFTRPNMDEIWSDLNEDEPDHKGSAIACAAYAIADAMLAARNGGAS